MRPPSSKRPRQGATRRPHPGGDETSSPLSDGDDVRGLRALRALAGLVFDLRALRERLEAVAAVLRLVDEQILAAVLGLVGAVALPSVDPFHGSGCHRN